MLAKDANKTSASSDFGELSRAVEPLAHPFTCSTEMDAETCFGGLAKDANKLAHPFTGEARHGCVACVVGLPALWGR
jgi:hypothetical protein